ncbi:ATP-binding protein [Archangium violaceum]|uniref:AAA family ATPase n=1 Tax=Archangium violaceum TaxID=83451 RepID=UPI002B2A68F5|nr:ATP-binding protein [Archangium gephyra]
MITSIQLRSFKGHRDTTVPLGRLTVLVGPNGTGKTSVLQALNLMDRLMNEQPGAVLQDDMSPQDLLRRSEQRPITLAAEGTDDALPWKLAIQFSQPASGKHQEIRVDWSHGGIGGHVDTVSIPPQRRLASLIGPAMLYHFDAHRISATAYSSEENPAVEADGSNTAVALAALKLEREEAFEQIESELRRIVPSIQRIRVRRVKMSQSPNQTEPPIGNKVFIDFKDAPDIPAHGASEGTLITLALLTALCSPHRPRILLLDDIDQSLHPQAQMELMGELKRLLEGFPEVQLVATTHSPYILDALDPSDVRVFAPRKDGSVACRSLSEHPQAEKMRGVLTAGQLWSLDPEWRWVVGEQ